MHICTRSLNPSLQEENTLESISGMKRRPFLLDEGELVKMQSLTVCHVRPRPNFRRSSREIRVLNYLVATEVVCRAPGGHSRLGVHLRKAR